MSAQVLIESIVRQVTILIAQLATAGGLRAPLAHIANQVFVQLARELDAQGVSRKVSADMFGMALRAYVRKVRRLSEAQGDPGVTLWQAVLDFIRGENLASRARVLERFSREDPLQLSSTLHDLLQSGLVFASGVGEQAVYRASSDAELGELAKLSADEGLDELAWVVVYREGPLNESQLATRLARPLDEVRAIVTTLAADGRLRHCGDGRIEATDFLIERGAMRGWEAAVLDHLQAVFQTVVQRLQRPSLRAPASSISAPKEVIGGSTYSFDLGPNHPLETEVKDQLENLRQRLGTLRERVDEHNRREGLPEHYEQVVTYVGQCILHRELVGGGSDDEIK
jgi:hypothetical protein